MAGNKENMKQAMRELLGLVGIGPEGDKDKDKPREQDAPVIAASDKQVQEVEETVERRFFGGSAPRQEEPRLFGEELMADAEPEAPAPAPAVANPNATIVAAGTSIFGDIRSDGVVEVHGKLKGDLEAAGDVRVTGKVLGDVKGDTVVLSGCAVQGNVTATAGLRMEEGSVVVGDISAIDLLTDGKIKGNIQVARSASFQKNAVLSGNVVASLVSMCEGAKVLGTVRIAQDSDTSALFGDSLDI